MTETREWHGVAAEVRSQNFPWWTLLITGLLGVAFGIAVLVWPDITLRIMAALAGVWLFIGGCARIIGAFLPGGSIVRNILSGIVGIFVLIAGVICLRNVVTRLALLALLFAITWILSGLTAIVAGTQRSGTERTVLIVVGIISLIAGLVFVFAPGLSLASLVVLTGISSIVVGAGEVGLAFVVRRANAVAA